ncbi:hypothetical protein ABH940_003290 [Streptacidiphilus sp. BW17]|uniref:hypothetical protein n=1 Tax=unclassified Streptacidiphilus TaxID=2643834 RepID=UPI0035141B7C
MAAEQSGTSVPATPRLSLKTGWKVRLLLDPRLGMRVGEDRLDEWRQAGQDEHAVWARARSYGTAVVALMRDTL